MIRFYPKYFVATLILFITEVLIALFVNDTFIRPYFGDFLVVVLMYCFIRTFFNFPVLPVAIFVLIFACFIEFLQYLNLLHYLGLENSKLAKIVLGHSFSWSDIVCYAAGVLSVILVEFLILNKKTAS